MGGDMMGKPSMFSSNYRRIMRRRKILSRVLIILCALLVVFIIYNKSAVEGLRKIAGNFISSIQDGINGTGESKPEESGGTNAGNIPSQAAPSPTPAATPTPTPGGENKPSDNTEGEYVFQFPNGEKLNITYSREGEDIRFTGIKTDNKGISYDIRGDGKAIVFDNPQISDIWIYTADGQYRKLDPAFYTSTKDGQTTRYDKAWAMKTFGGYVWAAAPAFAPDGRIVYQSYLPWFKSKNTYYLWVVGADGRNSRLVLPTNQSVLARYSGYSSDGKLIIELAGGKYAVNISKGTMEKVN
jgi:hypothetical protein